MLGMDQRPDYTDGIGIQGGCGRQHHQGIGPVYRKRSASGAEMTHGGGMCTNLCTNAKNIKKTRGYDMLRNLWFHLVGAILARLLPGLAIIIEMYGQTIQPYGINDQKIRIGKR